VKRQRRKTGGKSDCLVLAGGLRAPKVPDRIRSCVLVLTVEGGTGGELSPFCVEIPGRT